MDTNTLIPAHKASSHHRAQILQSENVGCFYCLAIYPASRISTDDWTDMENHEGQTALCPFCEIDSVIGDRSGYPLTREFLAQMQRHWFG